MFSLKAFALIAAALQVASAETARGLAWATDNAFAPKIGKLPKITWYHHWENAPVPQMPAKVEWVPMFWGAKKWDKWNARKAEMNKKLPKYLLGFNEVDVSGQAGMSPDYAVQVWMQEIHQFGKKGVKLGSPSIVYDQNWMNSFLTALAKKGGYVDFIQIHWYGSWKDIAGFKKYVTSVHDRFKRDIWVTELGITSASNGSQQQIKDFMMHAFEWMDTLGYVKRAAWFGCFKSNQPPDSYATGKNALFKPSSDLNDMAFWYGYSSHPDRRRELAIEGPADVTKRQGEDVVVVAKRDLGADPFQSKHRRDHNRLAVVARRMNMKRQEEEDEEENSEPGVDCDELCYLREASVKAWEDSQAA